MATLMIGYDLSDKSEGAYEDLIAAIKKLGLWWHHLDSTWLVDSELDESQILSKLKRHLKPDDELLVAALAGSFASVGFKERGSSWLENHLED